jgi:hypothetical protein
VSKLISSSTPEILAVTVDFLAGVVASAVVAATQNTETSEKIAMKMIFFIMLKF